MRTILQPHLKIRLKQRLIPQSFPKQVVTEAEQNYFDSSTKHYIAVKVLKYEGKYRPMVVAYDIIADEIQIITIHPATKQEINNKIKSGRWIKDETN